jgi:thiol-disulfide isomerase/thioredoxin
MLARYPEEDDYFQSTKQKLIQIQEDYLNFVKIGLQQNPGSFIARYVSSSQLPAVPPEIPFGKQLAYLKTHALDNVNFYDDGLIYSDAFTNKTIEYLTYYRNPQLPIELLEKEFISAVDSILNKAKVNEIVYEHIVGYLLDGFKTFGFDNVIDYIVENYVVKDDICLDTKLADTMERRIRQAKNFKPGGIVPDIIISDSTGTKFSLKDLHSERTLLLFYASWCTHCQNLLPKIYDLYIRQEEKYTEVVAVALDTSNTELESFLGIYKLDWVNIADLEGWNGNVAKDYFIYATPTMFLINKDRKLIDKPSSIDDLKQWF